MSISFPSSFLWGSSISSYQVEGGTTNNDWYAWEQKKGLPPCGEACRHYQLYPEDFKLAHALGHNALRLSLEWSRIHPHKDTFSEEEISHYRGVIAALRQYNLTPLITLHHFTNPLWFYKQGGWLNPEGVDLFIKYVIKMAEAFKEQVAFWIVFNEPYVYIYKGFLEGAWPPGYTSHKDARRAQAHIVKAYLLAYQELKNIYGENPSYISIAKHMRIFSPCPYYNLGQNTFFSFMRSRIFNYSLIDYLRRRRTLDFLGLNYYCREYVSSSFNLFGKECRRAHHKNRQNTLGWYLYPRGLYHLLLRLKSYGLPILITENGTSCVREEEYEQFLVAHIQAVGEALQRGVEVWGYMWWSLLDNFEWDKGYDHRFGLIRVNFENFERSLKPFADTYKKISQSNEISI